MSQLKMQIEAARNEVKRLEQELRESTAFAWFATITHRGADLNLVPLTSEILVISKDISTECAQGVLTWRPAGATKWGKEMVHCQIDHTFCEHINFGDEPISVRGAFCKACRSFEEATNWVRDFTAELESQRVELNK